MDYKFKRTKFVLDEPFRIWSPAKGLNKVNLLRDALNRIIHASEFKVGFEKLPGDASKIEGGAIGVIYLSTRTDQPENGSWPSPIHAQLMDTERDECPRGRFRPSPIGWG